MPYGLLVILTVSIIFFKESLKLNIFIKTYLDNKLFNFLVFAFVDMYQSETLGFFFFCYPNTILIWKDNLCDYWCWFVFSSRFFQGFSSGSVVKNLTAKQEMRVWHLGQKHPLVKEMATHSNILVWEIPQRSLVGSIHGVTKESNETKQHQQLVFYFIFYFLYSYFILIIFLYSFHLSPGLIPCIWRL